MLDGHHTLNEAYVLHGKGQGLADAAAKTEEKPDEESLPEIGGHFLQHFYLFRLKICLHRFFAIVSPGNMTVPFMVYPKREILTLGTSPTRFPFRIWCTGYAGRQSRMHRNCT